MNIKQFVNKLDNQVNKYCFHPRYSKWIFIFILLLLSFIYNYHNILFYRPQGQHQWRQCDCLSFALNYCVDNNSFFEPSFNYLGSDGTGKTISEFPIIYLFVGHLWKIFGQQEYIYRMITIVIAFSGFFVLFKLVESILKDSIWALSVIILLFTSPILVFYTNNFLPDVPAFGCSLIGWYFFWQFYKSEKNKFLFISFLFFTLGGLLKISSIISFACITLVYFLEITQIVSFKKSIKIFNEPLKQLMLFLFVISSLFSWYFYVHIYNQKHNNAFFLMGILPVWNLSTNEIHRILLSIKEHFKWDYFRLGTHFVFISLLFIIMINHKKIDKFLLCITIFASVGFLLFFILFFEALEWHDYYVINLLILMPIICLTFLSSLKKYYYGIFNSVIFRIIVIAFLVHNVDFARRRINGCYDGWRNENHIKYTYSFEKITPYLRSIGIQRDDKVICLPDNSTNITLYLMNQKGWTNYGNLIDNPTRIQELINNGAKYLILYDKELLY
ncbi:MAG: glycosyltransferase family 39 protein, partial [Bacteroidetes bacterium]|nr:glycosyltransferase family 39 protein [Bacteroidota bacterium]